MSERHYYEQGNYWPDRQRYGVLMLQGYSSHNRIVTSFHVCDLANCAEVVKTYRVRGHSGSSRVQAKRLAACKYTDDLNFLDREYDRAA